MRLSSCVEPNAGMPVIRMPFLTIQNSSEDVQRGAASVRLGGRGLRPWPISPRLSYTKQFNEGNLWATTLAWGRKYNSPGNTLDGYLAESELIFRNGITLFARAERVQNDELLERGEIVTGFVTPHPVFTVG